MTSRNRFFLFFSFFNVCKLNGNLTMCTKQSISRSIWPLGLYLEISGLEVLEAIWLGNSSDTSYRMPYTDCRPGFLARSRDSLCPCGRDHLFPVTCSYAQKHILTSETRLDRLKFRDRKCFPAYLSLKPAFYSFNKYWLIDCVTTYKQVLFQVCVCTYVMEFITCLGHRFKINK